MNQTIYTNVSTKESLKATYESNPDTNAFTDNEKTKLGSFNPSDKADKLAEFVTISTNHTIDIDDAGKVLICTNSQGITITVPGDDVFEVGTQIAVFRNGTGTVSFQKINGTVKTTTNLYSKDSELNIAGQYSSAVLIKIDTNTTTNFWQLIGDLEL